MNFYEYYKILLLYIFGAVKLPAVQKLIEKKRKQAAQKKDAEKKRKYRSNRK